MVQSQEVRELEERRRSLVAESEQLRRRAAGELAGLGEALGWIRDGYALFESVNSLWSIVEAGIGVVAARKDSGRFGTFKKVWAWWQLAQKLAKMWWPPPASRSGHVRTAAGGL